MVMTDLEWVVKTNISGKLQKNVNYAKIAIKIHVIPVALMPNR